MRRLVRILVALGALSMLAGVVEGAGAQTVAGGSATRTVEIPDLEARVEEQDALLEEQIGEISAVGAELQESQVRVDGAQARVDDLDDQTLSLERELAARRESYEAAKSGYEERARAAYKGGELRGLSFLLDGLLGTAGSPVGSADFHLA